MKSEQESLEYVVSCLEKYLQFDFGYVDYQMLTDDLCYLSGSSLVVMNVFDESERKSKTTAVSAASEILGQLGDVLNFQLVGKEWEVFPHKVDRLRHKGLRKYDSLYELSCGHLSHSSARLVEETFQLGDFYAVEISRGEKVLGEFALALPKGTAVEHLLALEMFVQQVGLVLMRSQAEKTLKEKEKTLSSITENMMDMVSITDKEGIIKYVSPSNKKILGHEYEDMVGKSIFQFLHPQDLERVEHSFRKAVETSSSGKEEFRFLDKNGEFCWLETLGNLILEDSEVAGAVFASRDISERKKAEEALKQSEQKYRQLFEQSSVPLWEQDFSQVKNRLDEIKKCNDAGLKSYFTAYPELVKDLAGLVKTLDVNQAALKLYRADSKEEFTAGIKVLFAENFYESFLDILKVIAEGGCEHFAEKTHLTFDGEALNIQFYWSVVPGYEETYSRVLVCIVDITEQKEQERRLRESEERHVIFSQLTSDYAGEYILSEDAAPTLVHDFGNLQDLTGYTSEELGSRGGIFSIMHSEDLSMAQQKLQRLLEKRKPYSHEFRIFTKDGELRWLRGYGSIREIEARGLRLYQVLQDITERKQVEEKVRSISNEYEKVFNGTQDALFLVEVLGSDDFRYIRNNLAHEKATGLSLEKIRGKTPQELLGEKAGSQVAANYRRCLRTAAPIYYEEVLDFSTGEGIWSTTLTPVFQQEKLVYIVGSSQDITERKRAEEKIRYLSFHDSLTGLYNRAFTEGEMSRLDTERQLPISIVMIDLNGLKLVNDTYGHSIGDDMLKCAAEILRSSCRKEDIIARWGGDEFVMLLPQTAEEDAQNICRRIADQCCKVCVKDLPVSLALGYSIKENIKKSLEEVLQEAEDKMYKQKLAEARNVKNSLGKALIKTLEEKSFETEAHIQSMQEMALQIGEKLNLPTSELNRLKLLLKLHDIGKINILEEILLKEEPLTEEEWEIIKKHTEIGCRITRSTEEFAHVSEDVLAHHERWDGTGYPKGLKGEEIPLLARITAFVDACEVMKSGRPYKKALSGREVIAEIKKCAGTQFDPHLVQTFLLIFDTEKK